MPIASITSYAFHAILIEVDFIISKHPIEVENQSLNYLREPSMQGFSLLARGFWKCWVIGPWSMVLHCSMSGVPRQA